MTKLLLTAIALVTIGVAAKAKDKEFINAKFKPIENKTLVSEHGIRTSR